MRFEKNSTVAQYFPENAIESGFGCPVSFPIQDFIELHSDAVIRFRTNGREFNVAIEYEDSSKKRARYQEHFDAYYLRKDIHGVIYIIK
jgi:hypothetical protein